MTLAYCSFSASSSTSLSSSVADRRDEGSEAVDPRDDRIHLLEMEVEDLKKQLEESKKNEARVTRQLVEEKNKATCAWTMVYEHRCKQDRLKDACLDKDMPRIEKEFPEIVDERK